MQTAGGLMKAFTGLAVLGVMASAGFAALELPDEPRPAPSPAHATRLPETEVSDELSVLFDLQDGSRIVGRITPRNLPVVIRSESIGEIKIPLDRIRGIQFTASNQQVVVTLQNGDKLQGGFTQESFKLVTGFGKMSIPTKFVTRLAVSQAQSGKPPEGCILWYSFDADEGDRVTDKSGHDNHGRVQGAQYMANGKIGGAYRFTGGNDQIRVPNSPHWNFGKNPFSIALWVSLNALPDGRSGQFMIGHDEGGGGRNKWGFGFIRDALCFHLNGPQVGERWIARHQFTPKLDRWYHLALTHEANSYKLYVNGECVKTEQNRTAVPDAAADLTIGQMEGLGISGTLDELIILDRGLTGEEVEAIYDSQK
jgi:hypothetical protein